MNRALLQASHPNYGKPLTKAVLVTSSKNHSSLISTRQVPSADFSPSPTATSPKSSRRTAHFATDG
jgi:hypothetical protein